MKITIFWQGKTITLDYGDCTVIHHGRVLKGVVTIGISAPTRTDGANKKN